MKARDLLVPLPAPVPSGAACHLLNDPKNHFKSQNCSSDGSVLSDSDLRRARRAVDCRLTAASCVDIAAWRPLVRQTQLSKATLTLSSRKPAPLQSPGNRAESYPQLTALPHSSKNEDAGGLSCLSAVIKYLNKGKADEQGFVLLTVQGYNPSWRGGVGPRQQELKAAGHLTSTAGEERATDVYACSTPSLFLTVQEPSPQNGATYSQEREALRGPPLPGQVPRKRKMVKGGKDQRRKRKLE